MKYGNHQPNQTGGNRFPLFSENARINPPERLNSKGDVVRLREFKTYDKTHYRFFDRLGGFRRMTAKPMSKKNRNRIRRGLEPLFRKNGLL